MNNCNIRTTLGTLYEFKPDLCTRQVVLVGPSPVPYPFNRDEMESLHEFLGEFLEKTKLRFRVCQTCALSNHFQYAVVDDMDNRRAIAYFRDEEEAGAYKDELNQKEVSE